MPIKKSALILLYLVCVQPGHTWADKSSGTELAPSLDAKKQITSPIKKPIKQSGRFTAEKYVIPKLEVDPSTLPPAEPKSYFIELTKDCASSGSPCWLEASLFPFPIPGGTVRFLENVNSGISLWFAYPGYNASHAPSSYAGVTVSPGQEFDPVILGYPGNMGMINPAIRVSAVALCQQNEQHVPCAYENAYLRVLWE
ncbi:hypothetical protein [Solemya elarraichensis gill symbiont]|uniref:Uncharacterized protein n=1 Tax=Solemya elarraichensis gill symbiont TaxID=1918949 RepID=A0A1T2L0C4_9GAMM|nr:hypothetical protein [Solemya elarraichensis gill symbiont]OOZ38514.1 hypothetical protein BOW52_08405 [Solemya elarraichensis gill symbiont]